MLILPPFIFTTAFSILVFVSSTTILYVFSSSITCAYPFRSVISVSETGTTAIPLMFVISEAVFFAASVTFTVIPLIAVSLSAFITLTYILFSGLSVLFVGNSISILPFSSNLISPNSEITPSLSHTNTLYL